MWSEKEISVDRRTGTSTFTKIKDLMDQDAMPTYPQFDKPFN